MMHIVSGGGAAYIHSGSTARILTVRTIKIIEVNRDDE